MKPSESKILLVKVRQVVGYLYIPASYDGAIIYAAGGPSFGDSGHSLLWPVAQKYHKVLFIPDYIGHCRSQSTFSFRNCLETLRESEFFLKGRFLARDVSSHRKINLNILDIIILGDSWGGAMVPFIEKYYQTSAKCIGLIKPVTDWATQGRTKDPEEDVGQTSLEIEKGWENIYRGYRQSEWPKIFSGKSKEYNPLDNTELLKNKVVYIYHGKNDDVVNWKKSQRFYQKVKSEGLCKNVYFHLSAGDHSSKTTAKGLEYILKHLRKLNSFGYLHPG